MKLLLEAWFSVFLLFIFVLHPKPCSGALLGIRSGSALGVSGRRPIRIRTTDAYIYPDEPVEDTEIPTVEMGTLSPDADDQKASAVAHLMRSSRSKAAVSAVSGQYIYLPVFRHACNLVYFGIIL